MKKNKKNNQNSQAHSSKNPRKLSLAFFKIIIISLILILDLGFALCIEIPVTINPSNATTQNQLICTWNLTLIPKANVTWYNGTNIYQEIKETTNIQTLASYIAKKNQVWNCTVVEWNNPENIGSSKVTIQNALPSPPNIDNQTIYEDTLFSYTLSSTDPDGDVVTFPFYESSTIILSQFNSNTGYIEWTPTYQEIGSHNITFYAKDNTLNLIGKQVVFNVSEVNDPPYFNPNLTNIQKSEGQKLQYSIILSDEENPTGLFNLTFNSTNCSYDATTKYELNRTNNYTFIFQVINNQTLSFNEVGNCTINIRALDPINSSVFVDGSFRLEVITINHPPYINYIETKERAYYQNENFNLTINATDIDEEDYLVFSVSTPYCSISPWNYSFVSTQMNASLFINASPLNESHIKCKTITITVSDTRGGSSSNTTTLNILNVNDAPIIQEMSYHINNTFSNKNISNLIAYAFVSFRYYINVSDPDIVFGTDPEDYLTFTSNSSACVDCQFFSLNQYTGEINFTPDLTYASKNFSYEINVTDKYGLKNTKILTIFISNNSIPFFNQTPPNISAIENVLYTLKINATDLEDKNVSFSLNTTLFNISQNGLINFTPTCYDVGNFSVLIKINDSVGAENSTIIKVQIDMSPDAPNIISLSNITLFENEFYSTEILSIDEDLSCNQEDNLIYSYDFLYGGLGNFTNFNLENLNNSENKKAILSFYTNSGSKGNYLINFSVVDNYLLRSSFRWNLTIINRTNAPVINTIKPYGKPYSNYTNSFRSATDFFDSHTNITIYENTTLYFDHNSTDIDYDPLVFNWTINNVYINNTRNITKYFDFDSSGYYNVTLVVSDLVNNRTANFVSFSWLITVLNQNRPPILNNSLPNITLNKTTSIANYFICKDILPGYICDEPRFYDPDGTNLTYTKTNTSKVSITIQGDSISLTALELGNESVVFTASDGEYSTQSNNVTIFIIDLPEQQSQQSTTTSGTKTSNSAGINYVPYSVIEEKEKQKEVYLDILVPEQLTIYQNDTIRQVISIINSGNVTLRGITLSATTNSSTADLSFSNYFISELIPGQETKTDLIIKDYKLMNHYEIIIWANVSEPNYRDKAIIYVNAIEKTKGNQSLAATKITFARDLLSSNPECLELNEYLKKSLTLMEQKEYLEAEKIVDSVIQGCKYLVSQSKLKQEKPSGLFFNIKITNPYVKFGLILTIILIIITIFLTIKLRNANKEQEQE